VRTWDPLARELLHSFKVPLLGTPGGMAVAMGEWEGAEACLIVAGRDTRAQALFYPFKILSATSHVHHNQLGPPTDRLHPAKFEKVDCNMADPEAGTAKKQESFYRYTRNRCPTLRGLSGRRMSTRAAHVTRGRPAPHTRCCRHPRPRLGPEEHVTRVQRRELDGRPLLGHRGGRDATLGIPTGFIPPTEHLGRRGVRDDAVLPHPQALPPPDALPGRLLGHLAVQWRDLVQALHTLILPEGER
jgi:hypothetical protein